MKDCSNKLYKMTHGRNYCSESISSRTDYCSSVCCKHGYSVELTHDELVMMKTLCIPMCEYSNVLQMRDSLDKGCDAISKFMSIYEATPFFYHLTAFSECINVYQRYAQDSNWRTETVWLAGAIKLYDKERE